MLVRKLFFINLTNLLKFYANQEKKESAERAKSQ